MPNHAVTYPRFSVADTQPLNLSGPDKMRMLGAVYASQQTNVPSYLLDDFEKRMRPVMARQARSRFTRVLAATVVITGVILILAATAAAVAIQMSGTVPIVF